MRTRSRHLARSISVSISVAVLTAITVYIVSYLLYPVTGLRVEGARMFPQSEAWAALPEHASLLTLNATALEKEVESNSWVEGARVTKDWESGIVTVEVEERHAVLNGDLGGRSVILAADGTQLPGLGGASLERVEIDESKLEGILGTGRVLESNGATLYSIDGVGPGGVEATVEGRRVIFSGSISDGQARALKSIMDEHPQAPLFDLRSPDRIVVGGSSQPAGDPDAG